VGYFQENANQIMLPVQAGSETIRRAQLGACFAIGQHFSLHDDTAMIVLPTGAGKTAVMTLAPFLIPPRDTGFVERVLVLTPSKIVRRQVTREFEALRTVKRVKLVPETMMPPRVAEVGSYRSSLEAWEELRQVDVAVAIPNSVSSHLNQVVPPPPDLFDVILVDEAHHSPATTWKNVVDAFPNARKVFFTATPYRRDRREIAATLIYAYPLRFALKDGIYKPIKFVPVEPDKNDDRDRALCLAAKQIIEQDKENHLKTKIIIRTDRIEEAEQLKILYAQEGLKVETIHSKKAGKVDVIVEDVRSGKLDGLIAVGMLGEGFDLPELKVAIVHSPHKSLASTLQFAGRISRDAPEEYGSPRFVAVPTAVNDLTKELFQEDQDWSELIPDLADAAVEEEREFRKFLGRFERLDGSAEKISLYGLRPYLSATAYSVDGNVNLKALPNLVGKSLLAHYVTDSGAFAIFITGDTVEPKWSPNGELFHSDFHLFVYVYSSTSKLLIEHATDDTTATIIRDAVKGGAYAVVTKGKLSGLLDKAQKIAYQQFGLGKTGAVGGNVPKYKTYYGANIGASVPTTDGRVSTPNHVLAKIDGIKTIGFSGSGSVWSMRRGTLADFYGWANEAIEAIHQSDNTMRFPGLSENFQTYPVNRLTAPPLATEFASKVFELDGTLVHPEGTTVNLLDVVLEPQQVSDFELQVIAKDPYDQILFDIHYDCRKQQPFSVDSSYQVLLDSTNGHEREVPMQKFLDRYPLTLFLADGSTIYNNELKPLPDSYDDLPDNCYIDHEDGWNQCAVTEEYWQDAIHQSRFPSQLNVQDSTLAHFQKALPKAWVVLDHGAPELADILVINPATEPFELFFIHCKAATEKPGRQVSDMYEVIGQAVKCARWVRRNTLMDELISRLQTRPNLKLLQGDKTLLEPFLRKHGPAHFDYHIYIAQPGLNVFDRKKHPTDACTRLLLGTHDWLHHQAINFKVLAWNNSTGGARRRKTVDD
jgi:superfamily II DNA or RNA helicase